MSYEKPTCSRLVCGGEATHQVGLLLRADERHEPAEAWLGLSVCEKCRSTLKVEDIVCDSNWPHILAGFVAAGKVMPCRRLTKLVFKRLKPQ